MKRTLFLLVGVVALSTAIYASSMLLAQTPATPATSTKTKVGLVNLTQVVKGYKKFQMYQEQLKREVDPFQARDTAWKTEGEKLAKEAQLPGTTATTRESIEKKLKELQRLIEDNKAEAQKVLVKAQEGQLVTVYKDIRDLAERIGNAHGYDLIMHYNDLPKEELFSPPNVARKMQAGACMPLYMGASVDLSEYVLGTLNAKVGNTPTAAGTGTSSPVGR